MPHRHSRSVPQLDTSFAQRTRYRLPGAIHSPSCLLNEAADPEIPRLDTHPHLAQLLHIRDLCHIATTGIGSWLSLEALLHNADEENLPEVPPFPDCEPDMRRQAALVARACVHLKKVTEQLLEDTETDERYAAVKPYRSLMKAAYELPLVEQLPDPVQAETDEYQARVLQLWNLYEKALEWWRGDVDAGLVGWWEI